MHRFDVGESTGAAAIGLVAEPWHQVGRIGGKVGDRLGAHFRVAKHLVKAPVAGEEIAGTGDARAGKLRGFYAIAHADAGMDAFD